MMNNFTVTFIVILWISVTNSRDCDRCVPEDVCVSFKQLNRDAKNAWKIKFPCLEYQDKDQGKDISLAPIFKADHVCCPNTIWGTTNSYEPNSKLTNAFDVDNRQADYNSFSNTKHIDDRNREYDSYRTEQEQRVGYQNNESYNDKEMDHNPYYRNQRNPAYGYEASSLSQSTPRKYLNNEQYVTTNPFFHVTGPGNNIKYDGQGVQCPVTSFPPKPESGCCGREASDTDRIIGGRETELEQFPWTVLLTVTFDYGNKRMSFNCGGSLISSKYVLTAGHCVYDEGRNVLDIDVYLAEYDKRTFPNDCKTVLGQGQKCIENIVVKAEGIILHPQYEDSQLQNDIALIRLQNYAPYTNYVRPICLPSINIDSPEFFCLPVTVAGWGRNGRFRSDIKQSTIVNLIPRQKCSKFYPNLSKGDLCAAGYSGEDTCKGDSGGPLMVVYGGKYEVVGVVSGKRADSPCGTSVPSLYMNVYYYLDWIRNNIKN